MNLVNPGVLVSCQKQNGCSQSRILLPQLAGNPAIAGSLNQLWEYIAEGAVCRRFPEVKINLAEQHVELVVDLTLPWLRSELGICRADVILALFDAVKSSCRKKVPCSLLSG